MNIELLLKVKEQILKEPKQFIMDRWFCNSPDGNYEIPNCGTAACIGGWGWAISKGLNPREARKYYDENDFPKLFDISIYQASRLFYLARWPLKFREKGYSTNSTLAAARIDHFIATNGEE